MTRLVRAALGTLGLVGTLAACTDPTDTIPSQLNLNRPVDMAFACYGGLRITNGGPADVGQDVNITAQPEEACLIRSAEHATGTPVPVPPGQEDLTAMGAPFIPGTDWYGFILQSEPGTVALSRWDTKPNSAFNANDVSVLDADQLTPGKNGITVGENPVAIATDTLGCYEVTANAGSCDLSTLEVNSALDTQPGARVDRIDVKNANGESIRSKPSAMIAQPPSGVIGASCPAQATGLVFIAYPGGHAVAQVDVSTGSVVGGITFDAAGVPTIFTGGNLSCPDECSMGASTTPGPRPGSLDMFIDPRSGRRTLAIGSVNSPAITIAELGEDSFPLSLNQVAFENTAANNLGFLSVALSPQIGMGGDSGSINDDAAGASLQFQFLYGVATDHTVRVADILNLRGGKYAECDEQVDPRLLHGNHNVQQLSCLAVGDPTTPARRPGVTGPGITLDRDAIPTSIAVVKVPGMSQPVAPVTLVGYFAAITAADGRTYILNIDDDAYPDFDDSRDPIGTLLPLAIANGLRDSLVGRGALAETGTGQDAQFVCNSNGPDPDAQSGNAGGPRAATSPSRILPVGFIATEKASNLPNIRQVTCTPTSGDKTPVSELSFSAPEAVRDLEFPDLRGLDADEVWTLTWEGPVSNDDSSISVDGPSVRVGMIGVDGFGMHLVDQTHPFCEAGVQDHDIVQLDGCDATFGDSDCPFGYTCFVHPESQIANLGACMRSDEADRLADACKSFLTSQRRYTVGKTTTGQLELIPRKHVLRTTPVDGCVDDNQCQTLATYADSNVSSVNPVDDKTAADPHTWKCMADPTRAAIPPPGTGNRCIETCNTDADCDVGTVCSGQGGTCMEGVEPPQACLNAPQRYEVRTGDAFAVIGKKSGFLHRVIADADGTCKIDETKSPLLTSRIPLDPPACDPTADPRTGRNAAGVLEPNPCSLTTTNSELQPIFSDAGQTCSSVTSMFVERPAPAIRLRTRGPTLTIVDPYYPGDARCNGDRLGTLGKVPLVFQGYQLSFRLTAGFTPLGFGINPSYPLKVLRGPLESIWVIDNGDVISLDFTTASTRGKVFRIESTSILTVDVLQ